MPLQSKTTLLHHHAHASLHPCPIPDLGKPAPRITRRHRISACTHLGSRTICSRGSAVHANDDSSSTPNRCSTVSCGILRLLMTRVTMYDCDVLGYDQRIRGRARQLPAHTTSIRSTSYVQLHTKWPPQCTAATPLCWPQTWQRKAVSRVPHSAVAQWPTITSQHMASYHDHPRYAHVLERWNGQPHGALGQIHRAPALILAEMNMMTDHNRMARSNPSLLSRANINMSLNKKHCRSFPCPRVNIIVHHHIFAPCSRRSSCTSHPRPAGGAPVQ